MKLTESLAVFRTDLAAEGIYDSLFGGMYQISWIATFLKIAAYGSVFASILFLALRAKRDSSVLGNLSTGFALLAFTAFSLLLNHPVDEVFISLRHSVHLRDVNLFSFNRLEAIEGIVDFLPYAVIGLLGKLGLPVVEMTFVQSLVGGVLVILAGARILRSVGVSGWKLNLGILVLSLLPTNIFNATIGFTANLFTAAILWSITYLFFEKKRTAGLWVLSLVPVIRLEGAFLVGLLMLVDLKLHWQRSEWSLQLRRFAFASMGVLLPLLALESFRLHTYGSFLPLPIGYKASFGSVFFLKEGLRAFWNDLLSTYALAFMALGVFLSRAFPDSSRRLMRTLLSALFIAVVPYYLSGGDWFPSYWARYLLPFATFATIFALAYGLRSLESVQRPRLAAALVILIGVYSYVPSSFPKLVEQSRSWWAGRGNFRIQQLSRLGNHLKRNTLPSDVIASSEVATVMFYAEREALDLLGVANPKFIGRPLIEKTLYRRRYPELIAEAKPEILYPGDFVATEIGYASSPAQVGKEIKRLETMHAAWNEFFIGGLNYVREVGYKPVLVVFGNNFSSLYFVSSSAYDRHVKTLKQNGFTADAPQRLARN